MRVNEQFGGARIKSIRKRRGLSAEKVAELVGVSAATIYRYENGDISNMGADKLKVIADALGVKPGELMGWDDDTDTSVPSIPGMVTMPYTPPRSKIPVIGSVRCGEGGLALEEPLGYEGADVPNPEDYFYLRATGDSMEPRVFEGDYILVHRQPDVESGELAIVVVNGEEGTLKKVVKKDNTVILQPLNPIHTVRIFTGEELNSIVIAGKAVEVKRKL